MIYITQLIYLQPGAEDVFEAFEAVAIPAIIRYNGRMLFRLRPGAEAFIEQAIEPPYEIHLVSFEAEEDVHRFLADEDRKRFLHLKEASIRSSLMIKGTAMG